MTDAVVSVAKPIEGRALRALLAALETVAEEVIVSAVRDYPPRMEITAVGLRSDAVAIEPLVVQHPQEVLAAPSAVVVEPPAPAPMEPEPPVAPHGDSVAQVLRSLREDGPVADPRGGATRVLLARVGLAVSLPRMGQILRQLEADGLIEREVAGRSTYRIAHTDQPAPAQPVVVEGSREPAPPAPADPPPPMDGYRVIEEIEGDDEPLVFKTREQRRQEIRDAAAAAIGE